MRSVVLPGPRCGQTAEAGERNRQDKECILRCPGYVALHNVSAHKHLASQLQSFASKLFQLGTVSNQADPLPVLPGASTPASPAVLSLCSVYGHACLLQPIYGYARTRHGPHRHDAFESGPSKPIRSGCSAWVQQPTTIQATVSRCHKSTQLRRTTEFTAVAYKYVLCNTTKQHSLLLVAREV